MEESKEGSVLRIHYESCLSKHGPNHAGVDWPNIQDLETRFKVCLDVIPIQEYPISLLDVGCGIGLLGEYCIKENIEIEYHGLDISKRMLEYCRQRIPNGNFILGDISKLSSLERDFDYIVANGVFTEKQSISHEDMTQFFENSVTQMFELCRKGIAFNVMSIFVDWSYTHLYYRDPGEVLDWCVRNLSRNCTIRHDYELYEFFVYVHR